MATDLTAPSWTSREKNKHRALVALAILASALIASAPRNERRLFLMPQEPMAFSAIAAPEPTSLRSAIMGYLNDGCGSNMGGASGGRANSFVRIADLDDCGRRSMREPVRAVHAEPGNGPAEAGKGPAESNNLPSAFFAMPDDPLAIDTSPLVDFAGLTPIPIDLPAIIGGGPAWVPAPGRISSVTPDVVVSGVPEPASWAMMIAGLGLVGAMLRRRSRPTVTLPA